MSKDYSEDFNRHRKETDLSTWNNRDRNYKSSGPEGREWKNHKYIYKEKTPAGYIRYYYEVPSEIEGRSNVVGYYKDSGENKKAMKYGKDERREITNKEIKNIEDDKKAIDDIDIYLNDLPKDIWNRRISSVKYDVSKAAECVNKTISAYGREAVANLTGVKNDVIGFFNGLFG